MADDGQPALQVDATGERGRVGGHRSRCGAAVENEEGGGEVERLQPTGIAARAEKGPFGILGCRAEMGVMVEMPAFELCGREGSRQGIDPAQQRLNPGSATTDMGRKHGVVHHLMQQDRAGKNGGALPEASEGPKPRPARLGQRQQAKHTQPPNPQCHEGMTTKVAAMQSNDSLPRQHAQQRPLSIPTATSKLTMIVGTTAHRAFSKHESC